ncbi:MAG: nucleoid-associated protein, partial [Clostridium saudiense]|nr:nucleoid-associated protein [Clostridium saudiense]
HTYLLAKVEHTDFVDDTDFSFKSGFSKDMKKLWKSCVFKIDDLNATSFSAKIYSNTSAKYWYNNFLELDQIVSDEVNTDKAFRAIDSTLNRNIKNIAPRDHTLIRNSMIAYFKSNDYIDYDTMVKSTLENYHPIELEQQKMDKVLDKIRELPDKYKFDKQFNTVPSVINARIRKVYDVCQGVQLRITDAIDDFDDTIRAYRDTDGNRYIQIKTDNDLTFRRFSNQ